MTINTSIYHFTSHVTPPFVQNLRISLPLLFGLVGHIILTIYHLYLRIKPLKMATPTGTRHHPAHQFCSSPWPHTLWWGGRKESGLRTP